MGGYVCVSCVAEGGCPKYGAVIRTYAIVSGRFERLAASPCPLATLPAALSALVSRIAMDAKSKAGQG